MDLDKLIRNAKGAVSSSSKSGFDLAGAIASVKSSEPVVQWAPAGEFRVADWFPDAGSELKKSWKKRGMKEVYDFADPEQRFRLDPLPSEREARMFADRTLWEIVEFDWPTLVVWERYDGVRVVAVRERVDPTRTRWVLFNDIPGYPFSSAAWGRFTTKEGEPGHVSVLGTAQQWMRKNPG